MKLISRYHKKWSHVSWGQMKLLNTWEQEVEQNFPSYHFCSIPSHFNIHGCKNMTVNQNKTKHRTNILVQETFQTSIGKKKGSLLLAKQIK